jgi:hypothetical protein
MQCPGHNTKNVQQKWVVIKQKRENRARRIQNKNINRRKYWCGKWPPVLAGFTAAKISTANSIYYGGRSSGMSGDLIGPPWVENGFRTSRQAGKKRKIIEYPFIKFSFLLAIS